MTTSKSETDADDSGEALGPIREVQVDNFVYDVLPIIRTPTVNPGESIRVGVYITGYGRIPRSKLSVIHSQPELLKKDNPGKVSYGVSGDLDLENNEILKMATGPGGSEVELGPSGITIGLTPANFADDCYWGPENPDERKNYLPRIMSEGTWDTVAPVELEFNTTKDATPGDYNFQLVFTALADSVVEQSQAEYTIHVNNFRERNERLVSLMIILAGVLALLSLLLQADLFSTTVDYFLQYA